MRWMNNMNSWLSRFQAGAGNASVRMVLAPIAAMVLIAGAPCVSAQTAAQPESFSVGDAEYVLNEFAGSGDHTILWLTSGPDPDGLYAETAGKIAALGFHVVTSDILDAYLLDNSRGAMVGLPPEDLVALYNRILTDHPGRLLIMAAGRVSIPVLRAINLWQIPKRATLEPSIPSRRYPRFPYLWFSHACLFGRFVFVKLRSSWARVEVLSTRG